MTRFNRSDIGELIIGANILAFPVAITSEIWDLSESISLINVSIIALASCIFLSIFIYYHHSKMSEDNIANFEVKRIVATYLVTLLVSATVLMMLAKLPVLTDPLVALKRVILVAFPASFSATVVDSLK